MRVWWSLLAEEGCAIVATYKCLFASSLDHTLKHHHMEMMGIAQEKGFLGLSVLGNDFTNISVTN